jgi:hypothetical protein
MKKSLFVILALHVSSVFSMSAPPVSEPVPEPDNSVVNAFNAMAYNTHPECSAPRQDVPFKITDTFSIDNNYLLLLATYLTEQDDKVALDQLKAWEFDQTEIWEDKFFGLKALISEHEKFTLVSFRGTTTFQDYINNALFLQSETNDWIQGSIFEGKMNFGYWNVFVATNKRIYEAILRNGGESKPVFFTGHSRGGNFALINAMYFHNQGGQVAGIQTWGQPRIGDTTFNDYAESLVGDIYHRVDRNFDITPHVPPTVFVADPLEQRGAIPGFLASTVKNINYDYTAGRNYILPVGSSLYESVDHVGTELGFYNELFDRLGEGFIFDSLGAIIERTPENHKPSGYICELLRQL